MSPSDRQIEEREARKQRILKGALEVFKSNGLEGATMDQIAQQSGFGKATLYYYFSSKEEVFCAIMEKGWKPLWEDLEDTIHSEDSSNNELFIDALCKVSNIILKDKNLYQFLFTAPKAITNMPENLQTWRVYQNRLYGSLRELLEEGISNNQFPNTDSEILFKAIGGLFHGVLFLGDEGNKQVSRNDIKNLLQQFLKSNKEKV